MNLQPEEDSVLEFEAVERWTVMQCPIFDRIFLFALAVSFGISTGNDEFSLLPTKKVQKYYILGIELYRSGLTEP